MPIPFIQIKDIQLKICCFNNYFCILKARQVQTEISKQEKIILCCGLILLILLVFINSRPPFYDEVLYLRDVQVLHEYGPSKEYLLKLTGSAGPLYSLIHYALEPLTHLQAPVIRLVNIAFLIGMMFFLQKTITLLGYPIKYYSLYCLAVPLTYVVAGLALTEIPAMFFLSAGLYFIIRGENSVRSFYWQLFHMILGGIFLSIAIIGRQPYLVILCALPLLFKDNFVIKWKKKVILVATTLLSSILLPAIVFWTWKGIVPPTDAILYDDIAKAGVSLQPSFFFLFTAYFSVLLLIIAPSFYPKWSKKTWFLILISTLPIIAINYFTKAFLILPFHGVTKEFLSTEESQTAVSVLIGTGLLLFTLYFLITLFKRMISDSSSTLLLFYGTAIVFLGLTCIKITWGFSSRYTAQAIPLLIPFSAYFYKPNSWFYLSIGILIGVSSLLSYMLST